MSYDGKFDVHDLYELKILEHVEQTPRLNNRLATQKLGVSLRLAHEVLARMVRKGLMHVKKQHARRWDYFLTPKGAAAKGRLTVQFLDFSMHFYHEARKHSAQVCRELAEAGVRQVAYLGANELAEICHLGVQEWGLKVVAVYADSPKKTFLGVPVSPLADLAKDASEAIIVCVYDPALPMAERYLPPGLAARPTMRWIFSPP